MLVSGVTEPNGGYVRIESLPKVSAYLVKPFQLRYISISAYPVSLRNIRVDDRDGTDDRPEDASILGVRPGAKAIVHRFGFSPAESGNAIVALSDV